MKLRENQAVIWDLDGTLLDSYVSIVTSLQSALLRFGICFEAQKIYADVIHASVHEFLKNTANQYHLDAVMLKETYSSVARESSPGLKLMPHAKELLERLSQRQVQNFVYTHKGVTTRDTLKQIGIFSFFTEIVTSENGFQRKPHPEALIYLMEKYSLPHEQTYYVGDRSLDVVCARSAGISSILLVSSKIEVIPELEPDYRIHDLLEISDILL